MNQLPGPEHDRTAPSTTDQASAQCEVSGRNIIADKADPLNNEVALKDELWLAEKPLRDWENDYWYLMFDTLRLLRIRQISVSGRLIKGDTIRQKATCSGLLVRGVLALYLWSAWVVLVCPPMRFLTLSIRPSLWAPVPSKLLSWTPVVVFSRPVRPVAS